MTTVRAIRRRPALRCALLVLVGLMLAWSAVPVAAHAPLIRAEPSPGAELRAGPARLLLTFAEPLDRQRSSARLLHGDGRAVSGVESLPAQPSPVEMIVRLPRALTADVYTVSWQTLSAVDGHTRRGSYTFTVLAPDGTRPPAAAPVELRAPRALPAWLDVTAKLAALAGAILLAGTGVFAALVGGVRVAGPPAWRRPLYRQLAIGGGVGGALLALGSAGQVVSAALPLGGWSRLPELLADPFGRWLALRLALSLVLTAVTAYEGGRLLAERRVLAGALLLDGLVLLSFSSAGHAAAGPGQAWGVLSDLVHLAAAAVWLGSLVHVAVALARAPAPAREDETAALSLLQRFSATAAVAVGLLLATGVVNTLIEVPTTGALTGTGYGRLLLVKLGLAAVLLAAAAMNAFYFRPRVIARRPGAVMPRFRRTLVLELVAAAAVIAATAALTLRTPARGELEQRRLVAQSRAEVNPLTAFSGQAVLGGQAVTLTLVPGRLGPNYVEVEIEGRVAPPALTLTVEGPSGGGDRVRLRPASGGHAEAGGAAAPAPDGHVSFTGSIVIRGEPGAWSATLTGAPHSAGARFSLSLAPPDERAARGGAFASPAPQVPPAGWVLLVLVGIAGTLVLAWRPLSARLSSRVVGFAVGQAVILAAALAVYLTTGPPAAPSAPEWGVVTVVRPQRTDGYTAWQVPSRDGFLMIPAVGPDGRVWVGEMGINKLAGLDPGANAYAEFTFPITRLAVTMGAAVDAANRVWLTQDGTHGIARFDPATGSYEEYPTPTADSSPFGIALDANGRVWFTEMAGRKLGVYDPAARKFTEYPLPDAALYPYWLDLDADGRVWFTTLTTGAVGILDPASGRIEMLAVPEAEGTTGIDVAPDGTVWFGIRGGKLGRVAPGSRRIDTFDVPNGDAYGVAVGRSGLVWVATTHAAVDAFDPRTRTFCAVPTGDGAWWVTVAADGSVWVAEGVQQSNALGRLSAERAAAPCG